jgi:hypothetical protein
MNSNINSPKLVASLLMNEYLNKRFFVMYVHRTSSSIHIYGKGGKSTNTKRQRMSEVGSIIYHRTNPRSNHSSSSSSSISGIVGFGVIDSA